MASALSCWQTQRGADATRSFRCVALGRKNFQLAGSDAGEERAAALYSLLGSAKLNVLNLEWFLREVPTRI